MNACSVGDHQALGVAACPSGTSAPSTDDARHTDDCRREQEPPLPPRTSSGA